MGLYELGPDSLVPLGQTTLASENVRERRDLQRLLRDQIDILDPDLLVISEEFALWEDSRRRIDLLAVDREANLVIIELKRDESGGHMDLQALRYAAMVSAMTWTKAVEAFGTYLEVRDREDDPEEILLQFFGWEEPNDEAFGQDVRIVLAAPDFGKELTTAVLWMNQRDLAIRCVRLQPFKDGDRVLLNVQQVIPLPEAEDFQIQLKEKARRERQARSQNRDMTRYDVRIGDQLYSHQSKRVAILLAVRHLCSSGVAPESLAEAISSRPLGRVFRSADGNLDEAALNAAVSKAREAAGKTHDAGRWFTADDELIRYKGRTYTLTKMWGGEHWLSAMTSAKESYADQGISFSPSDGP